jgi:hypothetical protein
MSAPVLYEAAQSMLRSKKWCWLKAWAMQIASRRGREGDDAKWRRIVGARSIRRDRDWCSAV